MTILLFSGIEICRRVFRKGPKFLWRWIKSRLIPGLRGLPSGSLSDYWHPKTIKHAVPHYRYYNCWLLVTKVALKGAQGRVREASTVYKPDSILKGQSVVEWKSIHSKKWIDLSSTPEVFFSRKSDFCTCDGSDWWETIHLRANTRTSLHKHLRHRNWSFTSKNLSRVVPKQRPVH